VSDPLRPPGARIIAIVNQKGGVGKTTTAINLAAGLTEGGARVLLVDLDPQGNASTGLAVEANQRNRTSYDILIEEMPASEAIRQTAISRLFIIPANSDLSSTDMELVSKERRSFLLRDALRQVSMDEHRFDFVIIDCPPSLNLLTLNALTAANGVLVPVQCEFFALEGLSQLLRTVERVRASLNPRLEVQGIVLTMFDRRNSLSEQVAQDVRSVLGEKVYQTVIPRNVRVSEAPSHGKPVLLYDSACLGSQAYIKLASEMIRREHALKAA